MQHEWKTVHATEEAAQGQRHIKGNSTAFGFETEKASWVMDHSHARYLV